MSIIRRRAQLPPPAPGLPGPFSLGGPGVLEDAVQATPVFLDEGHRRSGGDDLAGPLYGE